MHSTAPALAVKDRVPNIIIHIPHASVHIQDAVRGQFALTAHGLAQELLIMTDWYTDELFRIPGAASLVYPQSRLVADPERFPDDADEPMAARGMGAVYTRTAHGAELRRPITAAERTACLWVYYGPHHARLKRLADAALAAHGHCLILDAHSFPSVPLPCDRSQNPDRPDICIGTDGFHTPPALAALAVETFEAAGWTVAVNEPYAGALVPRSLYKRDARVSSLMVEINRRLYIDESTGEKLAGFDAFRVALGACLCRVVSGAGATEGDQAA